MAHLQKLLSSARSGNSYKVRLLEKLIGIQLNYYELDFIALEQQSPAYLAVNPRGEVPCLVDCDKTFSDSSSILVYLAGKHISSYWSTDLYEQAQIIDWLSFANSWVQYGVFTNRAILSYNGPYNGLGNNQAWSKEKLDVFLEEGAIRGNKSLHILNTHLQKKEWVALGRPTVADISVFVYVALAPMGKISLEPYENVRARIERIKRLPNFFPIEGLDDPTIHLNKSYKWTAVTKGTRSWNFAARFNANSTVQHSTFHLSMPSSLPSMIELSQMYATLCVECPTLAPHAHLLPPKSLP